MISKRPEFLCGKREDREVNVELIFNIIRRNAEGIENVYVECIIYVERHFQNIINMFAGIFQSIPVFSEQNSKQQETFVFF